MSATRVATFAAGCFWSVQHAFAQAPGVAATAAGYSGGDTPAPSYEQVCTGATGHAEAVRVEYDPTRTSYAALLALFWECHDPTTRDRQGPDVGRHYRSAIFCHDDEQRAAAEASRDAFQARLGSRRVVTEIVPASEFHRAEEYHQDYHAKRGSAACGR